MTKVLGYVVSLIPNLVRKAVDLLHLPAPVAAVVENVVIVFLTTFVPMVVGGAVGAFHQGTLRSLVLAAITAGLTAAWHYVRGLIPATPVAAPAKKAATKAAAKK